MFKVPRHEIGLETPADIRLNRGHKSQSCFVNNSLNWRVKLISCELRA